MRLRQGVEEIIGEVIGVAATAAIAGQENLAAGPPAIEQVMGETLDRRPVKPAQCGAEPLGVVGEQRRRQCKRRRTHFSTSRSIHFRLYQRSSFFNRPCEYIPIISVMASSTVFFGRKPVARSRSELTR